MVPVESPMTDNKAPEESSSCLFCCCVENNKCPKSTRWKVKGLFEVTIRKSGQKCFFGFTSDPKDYYYFGQFN